MLTTEFSSGAGVRGGCAANWLAARVFAVGEAGSLGRFGEIRILVNMGFWSPLSDNSVLCWLGS
jgi:hypothetical protein